MCAKNCRIPYAKKFFSALAFLALGVSSLSAQEPLPAVDAATARKNYSQPLTITPRDASVTVKKNLVILAPAGENAEYVLTGYFNGQIISKTKNTRIKLNQAYLENSRGEAAIYGEAKFELSSVADSVNYIVSTGKNREKTAALQCRKDLVLGGSGSLFITGNSFHGVKADDVKIKGSGLLYLSGTKEGAALSCESLTVEPDKTFKAYFANSRNGIKADEEIVIASGNFYLYNNETALKTDKNKDAPAVPHGITLSGGSFHFHGNEGQYSTEKGAWKVSGAKIFDE